MRVTAWTQRGLALGAALILAGIGLGPGGPGPHAARADGIMLIQAGAFWMGSDDGDPDERPLHRVYVRDFWLDRHKVTNREVALFLEARGLRSAEGMDYFDAADPDARISTGATAASPPTRASRTTRPSRSPGTGPAITASGRASGCPARPNGRRPRGGRTGAATRGATAQPGPSTR